MIAPLSLRGRHVVTVGGVNPLRAVIVRTAWAGQGIHREAQLDPLNASKVRSEEGEWSHA